VLGLNSKSLIFWSFWKLLELLAFFNVLEGSGALEYYEIFFIFFKKS
jgi:hypothetical protein